MPLDAAARARFESKVERTEGCWLWTANVQPNGYGAFWLDGRNHGAHRIAWWIEHGEIPEGLVIDHLCRVRCCVRPSHLEPVVQQENVRRGLWNREKIPACPAGHAYSEENTYVRKNGTFKCRACARDKARKGRLDKLRRSQLE